MNTEKKFDFKESKFKTKKIEKNLKDNSIKRDIINDICNEIIICVMDIERILLQTEQYNYRIKFGKFVAKYSQNTFFRADSLIDLQGWTYSMLGKTEDSKKLIKKGIEEIELAQKLNPSDSNLYNELQLKKARAYRHLGSDHNTCKNNPQEAIKFLEKGIDIIDSLNFIKKEDNEIYVGLKYGLAEAYYNQYLKNENINDTNMLLNAHKIINKHLEISKKFDNKHRYIKFLTLQNKIINTMIEKGLIFDYNENIDYNQINYSVVKTNLIEIQKQLNFNIYADEAIFNYLNQEVEMLYKNIDDILEREVTQK